VAATTDLPAIDLADPSAFVDGPPHEALAALRRTDPVHFQPMEGEPGFWAVLRHADVVHVARHPELFSANQGGVMIEDLEPESLEMMRHMLLAMDPPTHSVHREPLSPHFRARVIGQLEERVRTLCKAIMADARERGEVEFVHEVTSGLPARVIGQLMGLPEEDWAFIHDLAERNTSAQDPDIVSEDPNEAMNTSITMAMYAIEFAGKRRQEPPKEDLTSVILDARFDGEPMSDIDFGSFFVQLVTAGNDTTKTMLASGLLTLLEHPDRLAELRADRSLIPGAVEEILRYSNPLHYFRRTAVSDAELSGTQIAAGDKVAMYYTSANRDEDVFEDPQRFDIHRHPNPHLSFGIGGHFCLGVHLARLEGKVFFEELLDTFPTIELTGDPVRTRSNLNNALKRLPIRLAA
jgi:cytochrome P450